MFTDMTSNFSPEYSGPQQHGDNPSIKIKHSTQIVIENNSDDITISKCDQNLAASEIPGNVSTNAVPLKAQVLPLVYIKNNNSKIPFAVNAGNKSNTGNFIFSPVSTSNMTFLNKPNTSTTTISINPNQNVILAGRGRPLMLPKQPITIMPQGTKVTGTYVTMLKQVPAPEVQVTLQGENARRGISGESVLVPQNSVQLQTQPQKFMLAGPLSKIPANSVLTPMPKIQTNRAPITATTNSLQSTKFTVLPMPVPQKESVSNTSQKVFKFQISDGKVYSNVATPITIMGDNQNKLESDSIDLVDDASDKMLISSETIEDTGPEKNDISNKTYELSIAEEESLSNQSDSKLVVSSADSNSSAENTNNVSKPPIKFAHGVSILKKNFISSLFQDSKKSDTTINNNINSTGDNITIVKPSNGLEEKIVVTVPSTTNKKEREKSRRKSQFNFRKDFDEMDIIFPDSKPTEVSKRDIITEVSKRDIKSEEVKEELKEEKLNIKSEDGEITQEPAVSIIDPKTILDIKHSECDASKLLAWEENIGSLPGSNLKFLLNEFGIIEYLGNDDYQKILEKKQRKAKEKEDMEREVRCVDCGCYGMRADFINTNFCSFDCQDRAKLSPMKRHLESAGK